MKFNMGCGSNRLAGWVNVDAVAALKPDVVHDLERTPWPWPDDCAEEVRFIHSLEHIGATPAVFLAVMRELYRIAAPDCVIEIHAPHPRHDHYLNDPTHVRPITPGMLGLFDREENDRWAATGASNTPLAHVTGTDFKITSVVQILSPDYDRRFKAGELSDAEVRQAAKERFNVVAEYRITLVARKPFSG